MTINHLYIKYFNDIYRFVFSLTKNKALTEDIVQETFIRAYLNLDNFSDRPVKAWLFTVARNIYYDHLRKSKRIIQHPPDFLTIEDTELSPEDHLLKNENVHDMYEKMMNLKRNYREALIYFYIEELSYKDAAQKMNVTEGNFKSILYRARRSLRRLLKKEELKH